MHVAAVQMEIAWEDKPANFAAIERVLEAADLPPGTLVVLPELADVGFSLDVDAIADERSLEWATATAARLGVWLQHGYARAADDGLGRNCAALVAPDGTVAGTYEKVHPFSYGREIERYAGGERLVLRACGGATVCPAICYDLRFPELFRLGALHGAEVFTIGANWPDARQAHWRALAIARAIENQAYVVAVNRVGRDPYLGYAGGSLVVAPSGEILAEGGTAPTVLRATVDLDALRDWRRSFPALRDARRGLLGSIQVDSTVGAPVHN